MYGWVLAATVAAGIGASGSPAWAVGPPGMVTGNLFYNEYVPPDPYWGLGAQLYVSPRPTPPYVGHTFITYQPLMPQEFLYPHHRVYYRENPGVGVTKTKVSWGRCMIDPVPYAWGVNYHDRPSLFLLGK
jgi:hypothetical protein